MSRAEDIVADRILAKVKDELMSCNTEECRKIREEYEKVLADRDTESMKKLDALDENIVKMIEAMEKQYNTPIELPPCPHCGFDENEKPKVVGHCPDGHCDFDEYDKKIGMKKCTICGEDIEWND